MTLMRKQIAGMVLVLALMSPALASDAASTIVGQWSAQLANFAMKWVFTKSGDVTASAKVVNIEGTYRISENGHLMLTFHSATGISAQAIHAGKEQDCGLVEFLNDNEFVVGGVDYKRK